MNFVFDPYVVHIDELSWQDDTKKDEFLKHFLDSLSFMESCKDAVVFWSIQLESLLWENPSPPPWRQQIDIRNALVPIVYRKFQAVKNYTDIDSLYENCLFVPALIESERYSSSFKELCGTLVAQDKDFSMILGVNQSVPVNSEFSISCSAPEKSYMFKGNNILSNWLNNIDFVNHIWPQSVKDHDNFEAMVAMCVDGETSRYKVKFTTPFIRSILSINIRYKMALLSAIKQRVVMTRDEAVSSPLREEVVNGEVRIRITPRPTSTRAHFTFQNDCIEFQQFYGEGEHDDRL